MTKNNPCEETPYDEWNFKPVLSQHDIDNEELLLALNNHMDNWATTYTNRRDTAKKAAYNEILCCALQLSIKGGNRGEKDTLLGELITILKEGIEDE
ncbi:hypothetical protein NVP1063O_131 [Vibrio phage 1.063.O._10N.261.45.C7]|nr:hypothetical protein NVP1063O_131 [Vibrio phage 1.063.O._10N.261.45.C7]